MACEDDRPLEELLRPLSAKVMPATMGLKKTGGRDSEARMLVAQRRRQSQIGSVKWGTNKKKGKV